MVAHHIDKIVFSSTAATYGEPESIPILETDRTLPTNCYGETKLSMEKMFRWTSQAHDLRFVSLRYFNACGAHPIPAREEPRRAGDPSTLIASSDKAKSILGWKPQFDDLETIISTAWNWHKNHPQGYEK